MRRSTIRARLTALYCALLLLSGAALLGATALVVQETLESRLPAYSVQIANLKAESRPDDLRAVQEGFRAGILGELLSRGGAALLVVGLIAGATGWLLTGRALRPLHRITETARRIATAGGSLDERIALTGPRDEVKVLADTFDSMLERLDRSFDGQRRFVANASHELRTPLALNRALVELAVTRPDAPPEIRRLGQSLLAVNERHERLIDGLLTLADSEQPATERSAVDLADVVRHVLALTASTAIVAGIEVRSRISQAPTTGDPVLLERLAHNLVENAIQHNVPTGGWVDVETSAKVGRAVLVVRNSGPVVPESAVDTLFQPFRRLGGERAGPGRGFGLGLSIVRAVTTAHGGDVMVKPQPAGGLTVRIVLPGTTEFWERGGL